MVSQCFVDDYTVNTSVDKKGITLNPLTVGVAYIRVLIFYQEIKYHILNMLKIKYMTSTSNIWKELTSILSNLNNFHPLEVVDRVSGTQL